MSACIDYIVAAPENSTFVCYSWVVPCICFSRGSFSSHSLLIPVVSDGLQTIIYLNDVTLMFNDNNEKPLAILGEERRKCVSWYLLHQSNSHGSGRWRWV